MMYKYPDKNLMALLQSVQVLKRQQILNFFSDVIDPLKMEQLLYYMTQKRFILYNEAADIYLSVAAPEVADAVLNRRLYAFWVLAYWGSANIGQVSLMDEPSQFLATTTDNELLDITVTANYTEAVTAARLRSKYMMNGLEDDVNHIAVLLNNRDNTEIIKALKDCGYDSYCTLDSGTFMPQYTALSM